MQITIDDHDDGSQYLLNVTTTPQTGDVLVVRDPKTSKPLWVLRVKAKVGELYGADRVSSPAGNVLYASPE